MQIICSLDESQAGIKIAVRDTNNLRYDGDTILMADSEEELLMRMKAESEKAGLKLNIQTTNILASGPITSWQIVGEKVEIVTDLIFLGSQITADSDCSHEIKRHLLLERKVMTNLDSILKSRDIALLTKVLIVKLWLFQLDHKELWASKNCFFQIVVLEKTLESSLDS